MIKIIIEWQEIKNLFDLYKTKSFIKLYNLWAEENGLIVQNKDFSLKYEEYQKYKKYCIGKFSLMKNYSIRFVKKKSFNFRYFETLEEPVFFYKERRIGLFLLIPTFFVFRFLIKN